MSRPEGTKAPQEYYDAREARKYNENSRIVSIQSEITQRAIQMLSLPATPCYILDGDLISTSLMIFIPTVGCGSGLSGETLEEAGHYWVGCDISSSMLELAAERESTTGDLVHSDIGQGTPRHPLHSHTSTIQDSPFNLRPSMGSSPYQPSNGFAMQIPTSKTLDRDSIASLRVCTQS